MFTKIKMTLKTTTHYDTNTSKSTRYCGVFHIFRNILPRHVNNREFSVSTIPYFYIYIENFRITTISVATFISVVLRDSSNN